MGACGGKERGSGEAPQPQPPAAEPDDDALTRQYLRRLGLDSAPAPTLATLNDLIRRHVEEVPFENLDQHAHPQGGEWAGVPGRWGGAAAAAAAGDRAVSPQGRRRLADVKHHSVRKIAAPGSRRGGFCYELNPAFAWLLRRVGFSRVRLVDAQVAFPPHVNPGIFGGSPSDPELGIHVVIIAGVPGDAREYVVDPGFGDPPRSAVPLVPGSVATDALGDEYLLERLEAEHGAELAGVPGARMLRQFPMLLRRRRVGLGWDPSRMMDMPDAPPPVAAEPVAAEPADGGAAAAASPAPQFEVCYRFGPDADLRDDAKEFRGGLCFVLNDAGVPFTQKRLCCKGTPQGHVTLTETRVKFVTRGGATREVAVDGAAAWRAALKEHFGIVLRAAGSDGNEAA